MNAHPYLITQFVNFNANLVVPFYQRSYVWDEEQWERLMSDMKFASGTKRPYFMGAIILKEKKNSYGQIVEHTIIDGQQRLTTLTIFFKVLCMATTQTMWFDNTFRKLTQNKDAVIKQSLSCKDDYERIIKLDNLEDLSGEKNPSNIIRAYNYFRKAIIDVVYTQNNKNEKGDTILDVNLLPSLLTFVAMTLDENEDEQQIFDTINSLGVRLSTGELLKNYLFSESQFDLYLKIWKPVFEDDQETLDYWAGNLTTGRLSKKNIEVFLYYYLQIKCQERNIKGDKRLFRRWENLFSSFKVLIEENNISKEALATEISEYAQIFRKTFNPDLADDELDTEFGLGRINFIVSKLDKSVVIPYVMYIIKTVGEGTECDAICGYLEKYLMRRIICDSTSANYSDLFTENMIGQEINTFDKLKKYIEIKDESVSLAMPNDAKVVEGFKETLFKNNKTALAILYLLESKLRNISKHSTKLHTFDGYSLEHIMPKKWKKNWIELTDGFAPEERDRKINTLGNMAMITKGLNSAISNSAWENKRSNLNDFASDIDTIGGVLDLDTWNELTIIDRATKLAQSANEIWNI